MLVFFWCVAGILAGSVALTLLTAAYHWLFFRAALSDGQYFFVWLITIPAGAILGAGMAYALALHQTRSTPAGISCLIASALASLPLLLYLFMAVGNSRVTGASPVATLVSTLMFALPTVLWIIMLGIWAGRLLNERSN